MFNLEVDTLITDKGISEKQYNLFIEMGIDVVIADCENLTNS
jgi:predicted Fe-Mo cluster-binding NifX family protein